MHIRKNLLDQNKSFPSSCLFVDTFRSSSRRSFRANCDVFRGGAAMTDTPFSIEWFRSISQTRQRQREQLSPIGQFHWDEPRKEKMWCCNPLISPFFAFVVLCKRCISFRLSPHAQTRLLLAQGNFLFESMLLSSASSHPFRFCALPSLSSLSLTRAEDAARSTAKLNKRTYIDCSFFLVADKKKAKAQDRSKKDARRATLSSFAYVMNQSSRVARSAAAKKKESQLDSCYSLSVGQGEGEAKTMNGSNRDLFF